MIVGHAVTRFTVGRADAVAILGDFHGHPVEFRQGSNQSSNHTGFANAARMPADHDYGHANIVSLCSKSAARSTSYDEFHVSLRAGKLAKKPLRACWSTPRPEGRRTV